jgi:hypothetical protein
MIPESLIAHQRVRWQEEKMARPDWQHRAAAIAAAVPWHRRFTARVRLLRTRSATPEPARACGRYGRP